MPMRRRWGSASAWPLPTPARAFPISSPCRTIPRSISDWLDRLAQGCGRYTPLVALDSPDGLILDIGGAAHLFGGEAGLAADVEARMAGLAMTLRHALADTADAAHALARYQALPAPDEAAAIRRLPVAALGLEDEATTALAPRWPQDDRRS